MEGAQGEGRRRRVRAERDNRNAERDNRNAERDNRNAEQESIHDALQLFAKLFAGSLLMAVIGMAFSVYLMTFHEPKSWVTIRTDIAGEITFQGDGALYYSFYKDLLRAPTFRKGFKELIYNNNTMSSKTINAVQQLTLYPDIFAGILTKMMGAYGIDPVYPYLGMIFGVQAVYISSLFVTSWMMSGTWLAGVLAACWFHINRMDTTQIEECPPLRENWALPFFAGQVAALTGYLRQNNNLAVERVCYTLMCATTYLFIMMWEHSHYLLFVQALSLCLLDRLLLISNEKVYNICKTYLTTLSLGYLLQFKNSALLTSPLLSLVIASMATKDHESQETPRTFQAKVKTTMYFCFPFMFAAYLNYLIVYLVTCTGNPILQSLKVKFGQTVTKNFTTNWLLCQESFQPLSQDSLLRLTQSSLLPLYILVLIICLISMAQGLLKRFCGNPVSREIAPEEGRVGERPEVIYHVVQSLILGLLALTFNGLKYLWTPYVCVLAAFGVCSPALWITVFKWLRLRTVPPVKLAFLLSVTVPAVIGVSLWREFLPRTVALSELEGYYESDTMLVMNWIRRLTPVTAVFAASPQLMGDIKVCTGRMVTSLPVYNNEELMRRNEHMYQIYSMKSAEDIYKILTSYKVNYMVIEESICNEMVRMDNCRVKDMLDIANDHLVTKEDGNVSASSPYGRFCQELKLNQSPYVNYFTRMYWNRSYFIYKLNAVISFQF
ncbi:probable C-mannosyltransferase DPY19L4 isoform X2 [Dendrobates tinctorius]|uniref:probable C-mannosyltransferase DPY19L4 isoform X2 n=1 Tax=Dendrobates tinctorius TaxID=92724 RepID=UPI003CC97A23